MRYVPFVVCFVVWPLLTSDAAGQDRKREKWEYAQLRDSIEVSWTTAEGTVFGENWHAIADKLKAPKKGREDSDVAKLAFFNFLGEQGWEVATFERSKNGATVTWMFKRRKLD